MPLHHLDDDRSVKTSFLHVCLTSVVSTHTIRPVLYAPEIEYFNLENALLVGNVNATHAHEEYPKFTFAANSEGSVSKVICSRRRNSVLFGESIFEKSS